MDWTWDFSRLGIHVTIFPFGMLLLLAALGLCTCVVLKLAPVGR